MKFGERLTNTKELKKGNILFAVAPGVEDNPTYFKKYHKKIPSYKVGRIISEKKITLLDNGETVYSCEIFVYGEEKSRDHNHPLTRIFK